MPEISVIIPALNEGRYIGYPLEGLKRQSFRNFETIVVDGGSEDGTVRIARRSARVISGMRKGVGAARNAGAKAAKGRILLFLDADTKPSPGLLRAYHVIFSNSEAVAATGPIFPLEKARRGIRWGYSFVSTLFVRSSIIMGIPTIVGSNFAVRSSVFKKSGRFNENFITYEDWDLSGRLKRYGKIVYSDDAKVYTSVRRVMVWGVFGYFMFYLTNIIMYYTLRRTLKRYWPIR